MRSTTTDLALIRRLLSNSDSDNQPEFQGGRSTICWIVDGVRRLDVVMDRRTNGRNLSFRTPTPLCATVVRAGRTPELTVTNLLQLRLQ